MGAPDPRGAAAPIVKNVIDIAKGREFWSFQPPKLPALPEVKDTTWARSAIDRLVLAELEKKGIRPVEDANKATLLRRVYFDLTGLPPTPAEVTAFLLDDSPKAFEVVVDRLLGSPAFGERWGRHWLDVARYGESSGRAANVNYPNAWRYRDYVIAAFTKDKPYNEFVREQLAGDLMPTNNDADKAEKLIATGFLAIGPKNHNERNRTLYTLDLVDEQIDVTTQAFLGMTVSCARCHDHKFDPIPQKDYYALAGIFRSTETCYGTVRLIQNLHVSELIDLPKTVGNPAIEPLTAAARERLEKEIAGFEKERDAITGPDRFLRSIRVNSQIALTKAKIANYHADGTPKSQAMGVRESRRADDSPLYLRGEPEKPDATVPRGFPQVLTTKQPAIRSGSGRKELATWISDRENPLTARVWVNRVWGHLFGRGIVDSADNFGTTGDRPSNAALLDHLAVTFMDQQNWSTKKLIRSIVLSHAYQLGGRFDENNHKLDPENALVWRMTPQRLEIEALRDSILQVSGQLKSEPAIGSVVAKQGDGPSQLLQFRTRDIESNDPHRTVYLPVVRDQLPEVFTLFDFPDPSLINGSRSATTVPAQALYLMNNPFVIKSADATAERIYRTGSSDSQRIDHAYRLFFGRAPTDAEAKAALTFLERYIALQPKSTISPNRAQKAAWSAMSQAFFASAEFLYRN